jgi:hypothetical protein
MRTSHLCAGACDSCRLASGFRLDKSPSVSLREKVSLTWKDRACPESCPLPAEGTFPVKNSARTAKITVSADGRGLVSQAGAVLLWETLRVTGLGGGLSAALGRWRPPRAVHDPGKIIADLAAAVALGGDCLADIAVLREQPELAGPVASDPLVSRLVSALAGNAPRALKEIRAARAAAREREGAWALAGDAAPGADGGLVTIDLDATIVTAFSEKEQAAPTWKKTFGSTRWPPSPTMTRPGPGSRWPSCCGPAMPGPIPPPTTSRPPGWPWPSCPATCGGGC